MRTIFKIQKAKQHRIYQLFVLKEDGDGVPSSPRRWDTTFFLAGCCYHCPVPDWCGSDFPTATMVTGWQWEESASTNAIFTTRRCQLQVCPPMRLPRPVAKEWRRANWMQWRMEARPPCATPSKQMVIPWSVSNSSNIWSALSPTYNDYGTTAVQRNTKKTQRTLKQFRRVIEREGGAARRGRHVLFGGCGFCPALRNNIEHQESNFRVCIKFDSRPWKSCAGLCCLLHLF